eukprot:evm.model.scf_1011EXC.1 EVM.evm.TU.scf_1011EXC.1   scf_1011EXC:4302-10239(-)
MDGLLGGREAGTKGRSEEAWLKACKWSCGLQMSGGLVIVICSTMFLFEHSKAAGQIIGALLMVVGSVGMYGSLKASREALNIHLMGVVLAMMLAFQFVGQVSREMDVDCAIAEIFVREKMTETIIRKQQGSTVLNAIYTRLDEMEDLMSMTEKGVVKNWEHYQEQMKLRNIDIQLLHERVATLHKHAETLLEATGSNELKGAKQKKMKKLEETALKVQNRLESTEDIELSYKDYEDMLRELMGAFEQLPLRHNAAAKSSRDDVRKEINDLGNIEEVWDRLEEDFYEGLKIGPVGEQLEAMEKERNEKRQKWSEKFDAAMVEHQTAGMVEPQLADYPEHCIVESSGSGAIDFVGFVVLMSQAASGFCALTTLFKLPIKID